MRILYVIDSLASKGGAERIITEKMNYLANNYNYDVSVITCNQFPDTMKNRYELSDKVKQINLCIPTHLQYRHKHPLRLLYKWKYYSMTRRKINRTAKELDPDIIIGVGYVLANIVCRISCRASKVIESHEARPYTMSCHRFRSTPKILKMYYYLYRKYYLSIIERQADVVVALTKGDANEWYNAKRVEIIPNFSTMPIKNISDCSNKRIIAVGRLEWQKGYDRLIKIWSIVSQKHPDWQLDIFGEGQLENELKSKIIEKGFRNITIHPFTPNINEEYSKSSVCVLTSRFEGFALVLLEAMRHGVPCVTYDCKYGPSDVVDNNSCGYVVENGNIEVFAEKLCQLIESPLKRKEYGRAAIIKSQAYNTDDIMDNWMKLFESLS